MSAIFQIQDLDGSLITDNAPGDGYDGSILFPEINLSQDESSLVDTQVINLVGGWNMISTYLDVDAQIGSFASGKDIADIITAGLSEGCSAIIVKDYLGSAWLPEWDFNGIGGMVNGQGYQMKVSGSYNDSHTLTLTGNPIETVGISNGGMELVQFGTMANYVQGWSVIGVPINTGPQGLAVDVVFSDLVSQGKVIIIKDNLGSAFLPNWNFNGIGQLYSGQAYQMKTTEACSLMFSGSYGVDIGGH